MKNFTFLFFFVTCPGDIFLSFVRLLLVEIEIEERWKAYLVEFAERVSKYNKEVLVYNLTVPKTIPHKPILIADDLVTKALNQNNE